MSKKPIALIAPTGRHCEGCRTPAGSICPVNPRTSLKPTKEQPRGEALSPNLCVNTSRGLSKKQLRVTRRWIGRTARTC